MTQRRVITESFDLYPDDAYAAGYGLLSTWAGSGLDYNSSPNLVAGRFAGSRAVNLQGSAAIVRPVPSTLMSAVGFAIKRGLIVAVTHPIFRFYSTYSNVQLMLSADEIGRLILNRGGDPNANQIAVSDNVCLINNTWHYVEIEMYLHDSAGICNVYLDGVIVPGLSFVGDTRASSDLDISKVGFVTSTSVFSPAYTLGIDDLYVEVDGHARVGEGRMEVMVPNTTTSNTGWTQSTGATIWGVIDEHPVNITDYADALMAGDVFRCGATDLPYAPEHVFGVQIESLSTKNEAGTRILRNKIWGVTLSADGADRAQTLNTFTWGRDWFPREPDLGAVWTLSELTTLDIGVEIVT